MRTFRTPTGSREGAETSRIPHDQALAPGRDVDRVHVHVGREHRRELRVLAGEEIDDPAGYVARRQSLGKLDRRFHTRGALVLSDRYFLSTVAYQGARGLDPLALLAKTWNAESDFVAFMQPKVAETVKRAALKKLFRDPRFNVMDGLDVYIDDYSIPSPIVPQSHCTRSCFRSLSALMTVCNSVA